MACGENAAHFAAARDIAAAIAPLNELRWAGRAPDLSQAMLKSSTIAARATGR
jgi:hypothetical protein